MGEMSLCSKILSDWCGLRSETALNTNMQKGIQKTANTKANRNA